MNRNQRFINGKSITSYLLSFFKSFDGLEENYLEDFYKLKYDTDHRSFSLKKYEEKHLGNETLIKSGEDISNDRRQVPDEASPNILRSHGAANKEPIISSQSHNKESSREWEEKISALEKDLAEKERLIILKEEGNKELKKK
ncbi:hypothetical protein RhiirA4_479880 [Rhizophagus irregularis]|uniref:Uncharacterized protein n=1 Tax=Rhizophagus irregularis TaxID=588596 RepID=A0A2I1HH33_9GLOM|nr:hypothetical protein RhiirA4_479880 [Rhizophagus irregularis]